MPSAIVRIRLAAMSGCSIWILHAVVNKRATIAPGTLALVEDRMQILLGL